MMLKYEFKDGPLPFKNIQKVDAQLLGEEAAEARRSIERKENAGEKISREEALPRVIHAAALRQKDKSEFFKILEWNDKRAGYLYRLDQIRHILGVIRVVRESTGEKERAFVHLGAPAKNENAGYRANAEIISSITLQVALWRRAERDLDVFQERYRQLTDLCVGVKKLRDQARIARERLEVEGANGNVPKVAARAERRAAA